MSVQSTHRAIRLRPRAFGCAVLALALIAAGATDALAAPAPQTVSFTSTPPSPARYGGTYTPTASASSGLPATNYPIGYSLGTVSVRPAQLTITASGGTVIYGTAPPTITPTYQGFVNGDTASSLTTPPTCSTTAAATSDVGSYQSSCSGA